MMDNLIIGFMWTMLVIVSFFIGRTLGYQEAMEKFDRVIEEIIDFLDSEEDDV